MGLEPHFFPFLLEAKVEQALGTLFGGGGGAGDAGGPKAGVAKGIRTSFVVLAQHRMADVPEPLSRSPGDTSRSPS